MRRSVGRVLAVVAAESPIAFGPPASLQTLWRGGAWVAPGWDRGLALSLSMSGLRVGSRRYGRAGNKGDRRRQGAGLPRNDQAAPLYPSNLPHLISLIQPMSVNVQWVTNSRSELGEGQMAEAVTQVLAVWQQCPETEVLGAVVERRPPRIF